jgi:hypothetical protein
VTEQQPQGLSDEDRRALARQIHEVFANPGANSADVVEAYIGHLALNDVMFYTASGELGVHLARAVEALRNNPSSTRRFLGMPKD